MTDTDSNQVGARIRQIRKNLGLSMEEFAKRIDNKAKSGTVSNWETGKNLPNNNRLKQIARIGNVSMMYLLYGKKTFSDLENNNEKIPLMDTRSLEENQRIENALNYAMDFVENYSDYETSEVWIMQNMFRIIYTIKENEERNSQLSNQTREFLTVFLQNLNKKIEKNPDSDLDNLYRDILKLLDN